MSDTKIFSFGENAGGSAGNNSLAAILPGLLQNRGIDTGFLMGLMNGNNGNGGFFGNNGGFQDIIALIVIAAIFGNGNFGFGGNGNNQNSEAREMIMQTLNRNGVDIAALAQSVGASSDKILAGINSVSGAICNLGTQTGQNFNQVLTAMLQGNNALTSQIASCCCDLKTLLAGLGTSMERGFSTIAFNDERNKCDIQNTIKDSTAQIVAGQRAAEMREMQRELAERDRKIAEKDVIINNGQQTAIFSQMIGQAVAPLIAGQNALQGDINSIKCKLPETTTVPNPQGVLIPNCVAAQLGLGYGLNGFPGAAGFWG